ncbi:hypothetical protein EDD21DRAFT_381903 [Dissophora ornata]|nr:hypothetical protein BGZ58_008169 [Dissophora ornata]KAI8598658.1 hypothetical protein EDD21DRAFT_381903 [Dissophora ornata]
MTATARALSSPAPTQAQTKDLTQSHLFNQSALYFIHQNQQNALFQQQQQQQQQQHIQSSPTMSSSSVSSPTPQHFQSSPQQHQHQQHHPIHHMYTLDQQEQQYHHAQILGSHPASPESGMFLDLQPDAFMPTRSANLLFSDCDSSSMADSAMMAAATGAEHLLHYSTSIPAAEDCQASHDYMYAQQPAASIKSDLSNEHFAAMAPAYMMSMTRSFSEGQLPDICAVTGISSTAVKTEMCDSPLMYAQQVMYEDDCHYNTNSLYSNQHHHQQHHHHHSYSTSSLSSLSDDSSMSPRSTFSNGVISLSNSINSYPLSRTLSEPTLFHQGMITTSSSMSDLAKHSCESDVTAATKPTPKRSRGRRVSSHPDNSGCKVFTCRFEDCGKIFKRSEHLKRHVRSIHTLEKPFPCPIHNCPKRFSRSDNLNQHIRIHRHSSGGGRASDKNSKAFAAFTPFLQTYSADVISF